MQNVWKTQVPANSISRYSKGLILVKCIVTVVF